MTRRFACAAVIALTVTCTVTVPSSSVGAEPLFDHVDIATERGRTLGMRVSADEGVHGFELGTFRMFGPLGMASGGVFETFHRHDSRIRAGGWTLAVRASLIPFFTLDTRRSQRWWRWVDVYAEVGVLLGLARVGGDRRFRGDLWVGPGLDLRLGPERWTRLPFVSVRFMLRAGRWPAGSPESTLIVSVGVARTGQVRFEP